MYGGNQILELNGFDILFSYFAQLGAIPFILLKYGRIMDPLNR